MKKNKNDVEDEFDIFAKHIAVQLKQMPLYDAIICQEHIQGIIRQKRLQLLMRQSQNHTTPSAAFPLSEHQETSSAIFSPSQCRSSPSPTLSKDMDGEYWSSPPSNQTCNRQQFEEVLEEPSDILTSALTGILM